MAKSMRRPTKGERKGAPGKARKRVAKSPAARSAPRKPSTRQRKGY